MQTKGQKCWEFARSRLKAGESVALVVVVDSSANSPGRQGFKMVVAQDGTTEGTIGGGVMEYRYIQKTTELLREHQRYSEVQKQIHSDTADGNRSGMICSGHQTNLIFVLTPQDLPTLKNLCGSLVITPDKLSVVESEEDTTFKFSDPGDWIYTEPQRVQSRMYIVGGGHVGLALSRVISTLDFEVTVFDHRTDLKTLKQNHYAHKKIITPYEKIGDHIVEGAGSYAAIVSTTFKTDERALKQLLPKKLNYLGVMGSEAKIRRLKENLLADGFSEADFSNLNAPIGIKIQSHSAEEIAVSIAAQVIGIKNAN